MIVLAYTAGRGSRSLPRYTETIRFEQGGSRHWVAAERTFKGRARCYPGGAASQAVTQEGQQTTAGCAVPGSNFSSNSYFGRTGSPVYDYYYDLGMKEMKEAGTSICIHCPEYSVAFDAAAAATHSHTHACRPCPLLYPLLVIDEVQEPRSPRVASPFEVNLRLIVLAIAIAMRGGRTGNVTVPQCQTRYWQGTPVCRR